MKGAGWSIRRPIGQITGVDDPVLQAKHIGPLDQILAAGLAR